VRAELSAVTLCASDIFAVTAESFIIRDDANLFRKGDLFLINGSRHGHDSFTGSGF
jgi:hypothetical protein